MIDEDSLGGSLNSLFNSENEDGSTPPDDNEGLRVNHLKLTPAVVVDRVYFLGRTIAKVFEEANLHYWTSGTATLQQLTVP